MGTDNGDLEAVVRGLLALLRKRLNESPALVEWLGRLGTLLVEEAQRAAASGSATVHAPAAKHPAEPASPPEPGQPVIIGIPRISGPRETIIPSQVAARQLQAGLGRGGGLGEAAEPRLARESRQVVIRSPDDLRDVAARAELKADASRWCIRRSEAEDSNRPFETISEELDQLLNRAKRLQPCYLWMLDQSTRGLSDEVWVEFEGCYRNLARAALLAAEVWETERDARGALELLARAQSAVWSAIGSNGLNSEGKSLFDKDQLAVYTWCMEMARERHLHVDHLSSESAFEPSSWRDLATRLQNEREHLDEQNRRRKAMKSAMNKVRYHAIHLRDADPDEIRPNWDRVRQGLENFLDAGGQPSNPELVELLMPIADTLPEDYDPGPVLAKALEFVDERLAAAEQEQPEPPHEVQPAPQLLEVRKLLRGRVVVLIGGNRRPQSQSAIERELELKELVWVESRPHESLRSFEPAITRPETALVVLAIRWSSHSFEEIQEVCNAHDKPFVRLPGGYNPNQLAYQILRQQGQRLAARLAGSPAV